MHRWLVREMAAGAKAVAGLIDARTAAVVARRACIVWSSIRSLLSSFYDDIGTLVFVRSLISILRFCKILAAVCLLFRYLC